jgi:hypothetical protein
MLCFVIIYLKIDAAAGGSPGALAIAELLLGDAAVDPRYLSAQVLFHRLITSD